MGTWPHQKFGKRLRKGGRAFAVEVMELVTEWVEESQRVKGTLLALLSKGLLWNFIKMVCEEIFIPGGGKYDQHCIMKHYIF